MESEPEQIAYAKNEALVAEAKGFESLAAAITKIGPFESSGAQRTPEEIIAKINSLENAPDEKEIGSILQTIPRKFGIRGKVMDIMGL